MRRSAGETEDLALWLTIVKEEKLPALGLVQTHGVDAHE